MYKQNLKTKRTLFATLQDKQSSRYCKTIGKNLHRHLHCAGHTPRDHPRHSSTVVVWCVWSCWSRCICGHGAGEGAARAALAYPPRPPEPATVGVGRLLRKGRPIRPRGLPPRLPRLVSKQFSILSPHSWIFRPNFDQTMLCLVNFDSQQFATARSLKVILHQMFTILVCN